MLFSNCVNPSFEKLIPDRKISEMLPTRPYSPEHHTQVRAHIQGEAVPMVWVLPVKKITPQIKQRMREELQSEAMMFNGRLVVACACLAGGTSGGVTRDNIDDVMMEFEQYLDATEYNLHGPGSGVRVNSDEWEAFRKSSDTESIFQITDRHNSRTTSGFLERQRERKHFMGGWIPRLTWVMQPADVEGFGDGKEEVADLKVC